MKKNRVVEIIAAASKMTVAELMSMEASKAETTPAGEQAGADVVNGMAEVMVGPLADAIATSPILDEIIGEFALVNDISGYNYLTALHKEQHKRHPYQPVVGAETFPADIVNLWNVVKNNNHVLGDFTWTGYDYLGEAGCGVFHYDGGMNFSAHWPDRLAGIGDIDILGERKPISYLREAVYALNHKPHIGVLRMDKNHGAAGKTPWMWKDNISSWTWAGFEGQHAKVDVYANADEVELLFNGKSLGRKVIKDRFIAEYDVIYEPGKLEAISYVDGHEVDKTALETANSVTGLKLWIDKEVVSGGRENLVFVKAYLVDENGMPNRQSVIPVSVQIEGAVELIGFGSANPSSEGSYQNTTCETFDGCVMAVVRPLGNAGSSK